MTLWEMNQIQYSAEGTGWSVDVVTGIGSVGVEYTHPCGADFIVWLGKPDAPQVNTIGDYSIAFTKAALSTDKSESAAYDIAIIKCRLQQAAMTEKLTKIVTGED